MQAKHYDLIVFGGRNAISTAIQCGAKGYAGGACRKRTAGRHLSASRLHPFEIAHRLRRMCARGPAVWIRDNRAVPDPDAILHDTFEFTSKYDTILENALGKNVTLYRSQAAFTANRTLRVNNNSISADKLVLATGSRPKRPALELPYWTSDDVFKLQKMPKYHNRRRRLYCVRA
jgi:mycothione reductase